MVRERGVDVPSHHPHHSHHSLHRYHEMVEPPPDYDVRTQGSESFYPFCIISFRRLFEMKPCQYLH